MGKCYICDGFERGNLRGEIVSPEGEIFSYCYRCEHLTKEEMLKIIKEKREEFKKYFK